MGFRSYRNVPSLASLQGRGLELFWPASPARLEDNPGEMSSQPRPLVLGIFRRGTLMLGLASLLRLTSR
jgi:hypothetical protein